MIRWLKRVDRTAREVYAMFRHEMANPSMIGPHSPRLWRRGFYSVSHYIYDLARNPVDDYVPDRVRARYGTRINGSFCDLTRNKLAFQLLLKTSLSIPVSSGRSSKDACRGSIHIPEIPCLVKTRSF